MVRFVKNSHFVENDNFLSEWEGRYVRTSSLADLINSLFGILMPQFGGKSLLLCGNAYRHCYV